MTSFDLTPGGERLVMSRGGAGGKPDEGGKFVETKYRCRSCSHEWWELIPAPPEPRRTDAGDAA